jgi:hypothetical protein
MEIDAVSSVEFSNPYVTEEMEESTDLHKSIFSPIHHFKFSRNATPTRQSHTDLQASKLMHARILNNHPYDCDSKRSNVEIRGTGRAEITWGDPEKGMQMNFSISGEASDHNGNFTGARFKQGDDGMGSIVVEAGYDSARKKTTE